MSERFHHVAQFNIARAIAPLDSCAMSEFMAELEPVNALADAAQGFVWRLQTGEGNATDLRAYDDPRVIVNMSVWRSVDALHRFVYAERHARVMSKRKEWFEPLETAHLVLWWIRAASVPSVEEGKARLAYLHAHGPTPHAFTFKSRFAPPATSPPEVLSP